MLDEIPASMRRRVTEALVAEPEEFWIERARAQLRLTTYRLVFRKYFQSRGRDALPLPPEPVWDVNLSGEPRRHRIDGHDVVGVEYELSSVLVSDEDSPAISEPRLRRVGGTWREPFVLPVDPELLLQRTGYACMSEEDFPFGSVDSEEVAAFYDQEVVVEKGLSNVGQSHFTVQPKQSCVEALRDHVGAVTTPVEFERLAWDPALAGEYRYGEVTGTEPDLAIYLPDFAQSRTNYRYIHGAGSGGCEVVEKMVDGTGWRRLLQFATSDENVGERELTIGGVDYTISGHPEELEKHNLYEFSACHRHNHFKYYGDLSWEGGGEVINVKNGFCLQSTDRAANRETSPLHNPFDTCDYQGVAAGWIDQYKAGLPGQWIDTTDLPPGIGTRSFHSNPEGVLCEGSFIDMADQPLGPKEPVIWEATGLTADDGDPVEAPRCRLSEGWDDNNSHSAEETIEPHGLGLITSPCTRGQIGPLRNCGFGEDPETANCTAGQRTVATFSIPSDAAPQVVRLTEFSHALNSPIPARYEDSYVPLRPGVSDQPAMLANAIVMPGSRTRVTFRCPSPRTGGVREPGGTYSVYTAPVLPDDPAAAVTSR